MCARLNLADFISASSRPVQHGSDTPEAAQSFPDSSRGAKAALETADQRPEAAAIVIARVIEEYSGTTEIESTSAARTMS
jgi:hypothetical protein